MGTPLFITLGFIALHGCFIFCKLKTRPSTSKKITTHFIAILVLLRGSGTELAISPRYVGTPGVSFRAESVDHISVKVVPKKEIIFRSMSFRELTNGVNSYNDHF